MKKIIACTLLVLISTCAFGGTSNQSTRDRMEQSKKYASQQHYNTYLYNDENTEKSTSIAEVDVINDSSPNEGVTPFWALMAGVWVLLSCLSPLLIVIAIFLIISCCMR